MIELVLSKLILFPANVEIAKGRVEIPVSNIGSRQKINSGLFRSSIYPVLLVTGDTDRMSIDAHSAISKQVLNDCHADRRIGHAIKIVTVGLSERHVHRDRTPSIEWGSYAHSKIITCGRYACIGLRGTVGCRTSEGRLEPGPFFVKRSLCNRRIDQFDLKIQIIGQGGSPDFFER